MPKPHKEYLNAQEDLQKLKAMHERVKLSYEREMGKLSRELSLAILKDMVLGFLSLGFVSNHQYEKGVKNKLVHIHEIFNQHLNSIEQEISSFLAELEESKAINDRYVINMPTCYNYRGYPNNWRDLGQSIRERDQYSCQKCGSSNVVLHVHHVIPLSQGGSNAPSNLITLCAKCHSQKHPHMRG